MTHSNDSQRPHRTRRQLTAAALVLLASVGWAQQVSAWDYVEALAIDPDTPTTLYAGTQCAGVFKSLDGGDSWSAVNTGLPPLNPFRGVPTVHALAIDPSTPATLYAGADGYNNAEAHGVFKSLNGGSNWSAVNTGLPDYTIVYALAIDPTAPTTLYAGTPTGGVFRSVNGGSSWSAVNTGLTHPYIRSLAINPTTPTTLYAGTELGVFRSVNGGSNWSAVNTGLTDPCCALNVDALAIDPATPTTLYAATERGVFKSLNGGSSWNAVNAGLPDYTVVHALAINPTTPASLYAAGGGVFRSLNGGSSWQTAGLSNIGIQAIAIDPLTPSTLYAGGGAGNSDTGPGGVVYKSTDAGTSWQETGPLGCGDGAVRCDEHCDDSGESATCDINCTWAGCGDGTLNPTAGEECDDGNRNPFDGCTNQCTVCGDGSVAPPEECDDGNTSSGDDCDAQCRRPRVVGKGTPESCTEAEFEAALAERAVSFDCGPAPATITVTSEKVITRTTTLDGEGLITLSGGGTTRIFTVAADAAFDARDLTIADGKADRGGGIYNLGAATLTNCTLRDNSAEDRGGAISNGGTLTVTNSTFSGNSAGYGDGALLNRAGSATLTNCTLSDNDGGISNAQFCDEPDSFGVSPSPRVFPNCHFGSVTLTNTIILELAGQGCSGPIIDGGHNLQFLGTSCGETILSFHALLDPAGLQDNGGPTQTIALRAGSPAIDAGDPEVCANWPVNGVDQRGYVRPGTGSTTCSIGAYEFDSPGPPPCVGDCDGNGAVAIYELVTLVNIGLGVREPEDCTLGDADGDGSIGIAEIVAAVIRGLEGCT